MAENSAYVNGRALTPGDDGRFSPMRGASVHAFASTVEVGRVAIFWNPNGRADDAESITISAEDAETFAREFRAVAREARRRGYGAQQ